MKLTMILLLIFLLATLAYAGTLKDDFSDGKLNGWTESDPWGMTASWTVDNRELIGISKSAEGWDTHLYLSNSHSWKDYDISVRVKIITVSIEQLCAAGLLMRQISPKQYMHFKAVVHDKMIGPDSPKLRFLEMNSDNWEITEEPFDVELNKWYDLKLEASGNRFKCYVDGSKVIDCKYNKFDNGAVGLAINGAEAHFDNFVITGDDVPDMNLSIRPKAKLTTTWGLIRSSKL